mmetsp:Transcript_7523/g.31838  ORF Transcript_7523/g.31838 Transcript_7523/m.31838 type:complete len:205 (-) Transcript_7523:1724-2338(-)
MPLHHRIPLHPQHVYLDRRRFRQPGAEGAHHPQAGLHGALCVLLPDGAERGLRRGVAAYDGKAERGRRALRAQRRQGFHQRRRRERRLHGDGAHRRRGPQGHHVFCGGEGLRGPELWQEGGEARLELPAHARRLLRGLQGARRQPHRRRGAGLRHCHEGTRRRPRQHRCLQRGRGACVPGASEGAPLGAQAVWPDALKLPAPPV